MGFYIVVFLGANIEKNKDMEIRVKKRKKAFRW